MTSTPPLRNVYTAQQFATEVLCGNRSTEWVQDQCAKRNGGIRWVARKPYLIPRTEAERFLGLSPQNK